MARISIEGAPPTALPRLFLSTTPFWGAIAGALLVADGAIALQTRWAPSTLALVHALTLGVLGNAMFGSLLQFLPAAAGVRVRGGANAARVLHALLNLGTLLLVAGFRAMRPACLMAAGVALAASFALLAAMLLPGLIARGFDWISRTHRSSHHDPAGPTHVGIAFALGAALLNAALGMGMLAGLCGLGGLPVLPWANVHAGWGVLGWVLGLLSGVGAVVLPMFQGTRTLPARAMVAWLATLGTVLVASTLVGVAGWRIDLLRWSGATCLAVFAAVGLWLQLRAPRTRNAWLLRAWRAGLLALALAAVVLAAGGPAVLLGVLVLAVGLPWLVVGMQLEILAFLGWIELHRRCGRGVRLPPVQTLLPEAHKAEVFAWHALSALALLTAALWPAPATARIAGIAMLGSHAWLWLRLRGIGARMRTFQATGGIGGSPPVPLGVGGKR